MRIQFQSHNFRNFNHVSNCMVYIEWNYILSSLDIKNLLNHSYLSRKRFILNFGLPGITKQASVKWVVDKFESFCFINGFFFSLSTVSITTEAYPKASSSPLAPPPPPSNTWTLKGFKIWKEKIIRIYRWYSVIF